VFTARYEPNICVFCVDLRTNSDYFPVVLTTGFYNRDGSVFNARQNKNSCSHSSPVTMCMQFCLVFHCRSISTSKFARLGFLQPIFLCQSVVSQ
jgi:hypothetical protein